MSPRWMRVILAAALGLSVALPVGAGVRRLCTEPVSATLIPGPKEAAALPPGAAIRPLLSPPTRAESASWHTLLRERLPLSAPQDRRYYWLHVALATALQLGQCSVEASGVQWVKAGVHARTVSQAERVSGGLASIVTHSAAPDATARTLCLVASPRNWEDFDHVSLTFAMAGVYCAPGMTPARVLEAARARSR